MKMLSMQLLRDLRSQWSRYLASALLILLGIVVSAGMAAGNGSALNTAKDAQDTGNVEDGYLELTAELTNDQLTSLRNKGLTFERAEFTDVPAADNSTVRVYENRSTIDRINLESGALPTANDEIALEQTYARAHNLKVGDTLDLDGTRLTITGIGSTPDYATVVARPTDTAADPNEFGTAFTAASTVESLPFAFSFRLRSFMRAWTTYVLMLLGVVLSLLLMVFSFGMHDSVVSYADDVREDIDFEVVYVFLGAPPTSPDGAETATLRSAKLVGAEGAGASLSVIGIDKDTKYFDVDLSGTDETHVLISKAVSLRYGYEVGDEFTLDPMDTDNRKVVVAGIVDYPQMAVFGEHEDVNSLLGLDRGSSNAIVSGTVNDDLDNQAQSVISRSDMITSVNTFTQAMRPTILVLFIASIGLFIIVMFLLMRMVVDREQYSISLMKALGYDEAKVGHLYLGNYVLLVLLSLTVGLPLSVAIMRPTWQYMISSLATAFPFTTSSRSVILIVVIVLATYGVVRFLSGRHLRGVDVTEILKDRE